MDNDELKILLEAALVLAESVQNIKSDLAKVQEQLKNYRIKILAGLDREHSAAQIRDDLQQLGKGKHRVKIVGEVDKSATKKNVDAAIKNLRNAEIKIAGVLDSDALKQRLGSVPDLSAKVSADVSGAEEVDNLRQKMDKAGNSAENVASKLYLVRSALQLLRRTCVEAKETIIGLDSAVTDLTMATGQSREKTYELLQDYNKLAKQLGAVTTQVSDAADQWLRQGHSINDTTTLIKDAMVLSKVSQLDSAAATEYLTASMKGYGIAVRDVIGIVDKLSAVDLESATDAGGLAEAMSRTAVTANMAGINMNRLLGYVATVGEVTQKSMSSVGESFKTIFSRMSDIKANKLELIDEDGTTETLSDVELTLKNVGIDLRKTVNEYNNYGDVLDNLAAKWDTLTNVQQNALTKAFAGTRQGENFRVLMQNYGKAIEYTEVAANSAGTALQKFSSYQDSIEAKSAAFTAAMESLTLDTVDSELVKDLIDASTSVVEFVEQTGLLKATLISLGAGGVLKGIGLISNGFITAKQDVLNLGTAINTLRNIDVAGGLSSDIIGNLGKLTKGLNDEQMKLVLTTQQLSAAQMSQILVAGGLSQAEASAKLQALGLATAQGTATGATWSLSTAMTGLGASIRAAFAVNPIGIIMLAVGAAYELGQGVLALHDAISVTAEEARETADELHAAFEETASELEKVNTELETSRDRIAELQKLSESGTISIVEQEELENLREEVGLLEQRARFLKAQKEREANESNDALEDAFTKKTFTPDLYTYAIDGLRKERDELDKVRKSWTDADEDRYNKIVASISHLGEMSASEGGGIDAISGMRRGKSMGYAEYIQLLIDRYNELNKTAEKTASDFYEMDALEGRLADIGVDLTGFIQQFEGESDVKTFWQKLSEDIDRTINKAEYFTEALEALPFSAKGELEAIGKAGKLTAESVDELAQKFPELKAWMEESKYTAEDVASNFNALSVSSENAAGAFDDTKKSISSIIEPLDKLAEKYSLLESAQKELRDDGGISSGTLDKLHEQYESMGDIIALYKLGLATAQDVYAEYERLYNTDKQSFVDSNAWKIANTEEYFNKNIKGHKDWVEAIGEYYTADFKNFSELAKKKLGLETELARKLGENWSKYYSTFASAVRNSYVMLDSEGDFNRSKSSGGMSQYANYSDYVAKKTSEQQSGWSAETKAAYNNAMQLAKAIDSASNLMKDLDLDLTLGTGKSKSGSSSSKKEVEAYIADIDKYREATERLRKVQEEKEQIDRRINDSDDLRQRILLERQLINSYQNESSAVQTLNKLRSETIASNVESLRKLEFEVQYNSDTNELWISNMEKLNELTAKSKGKYGSLQEATNALRKETEDLIKTTTSLNEENRDGADSIYELGVSVRDAKSKIVEDLKDIVTQASDAVDEIQNVYDTLKSAAEEYESNGGYISIDTFQSILSLGPQYMQYLMDENDLLLINEERINKVIEAKTRQLAAEQALTYVERLKAALQDNSIENLNTLLYATTDATSATFGLAYAELELMHQMGELDDVQYSAAMHNIDAIRSLCETAVGSIGKVSGAAEKAVEESKKQLESLRDELEDMQDAGDDIIKYVMDMLKHRIQQQIDLLEEMKDKYSEIIALKKESLRASKEEEDYQKSIKSKLREMAKLQEKIDALGLDDSRSAQAEKAKLLEDLAELQDDLNDTQSEKAISATEDALDKMEEAYHQEKDNEIKILEDSISSYQKLWSKAIEYIRSNYSTLLAELTDWNTNYGQVLNSEIEDCWNRCQSAAQRYGDFVSAMMGGIKNEIASINAEIESLSISSSVGGSTSSSNSPNVVGKVDRNPTITNDDRIGAIIRQMYSNMNEHGGSGSSTSEDRKRKLSQENLNLGNQLKQYGINAHRSTDKEDLGTWYTDSTKREKLFDEYRRYIYHTGGIAGDNGTLKDDEILAKLQKGEPVLTQKMWDNVKSMMERMDRMSKMMSALASKPPSPIRSVLPDLTKFRNSTIHNVTNNSSQPVEINFGDTIINGGSDPAVVIADRVKEITYENVNQIAKKLKLAL